jgi:hypothetical protein
MDVSGFLKRGMGSMSGDHGERRVICWDDRVVWSLVDCIGALGATSAVMFSYNKVACAS